MIIPSGLAPWLRANDHTTYGGRHDKMNYQSQGVVDPRTDISAEQFVRLCEDLASVVRVCPYGYLMIQCDDTTPTDPTVLFVYLMNVFTEIPYLGSTPGLGMPTVERVSNGVFTVSFVSPAEDAYGIEGDVIIKGVVPTVENPGSGTVEAGYTVSGNIVTVNVTDDVGPVSNPKVFLKVWT